MLLRRLPGHIDKIDHHHTAHIPQPQLAGRLSGCLKIGPQNRILKIALSGKLAGIDIDHRHGLGALDQQKPTAFKPHPAVPQLPQGLIQPPGFHQAARLVKVLHLRPAFRQQAADKRQRCRKAAALPLHRQVRAGFHMVSYDPQGQRIFPTQQAGHTALCLPGQNLVPLCQQRLALAAQLRLGAVRSRRPQDSPYPFR